MIDRFIELANEVVLRPSLGKLLTILTIIVTVVVGVVLYERATSDFRLDRIQRTAEAITAFQSIDTVKLKNNAALTEAYHVATEDLRTSAKSRLSMPFIGLLGAWNQPNAGLKFLAGASLWLAFMLYVLKDTYRGNLKAPPVVLEALTMALVLGAINVWITQGRHYIIGYVVSPIVLTVLSFGGFIGVEVFVRQYRLARAKNADADPSKVGS